MKKPNPQPKELSLEDKLLRKLEALEVNKWDSSEPCMVYPDAFETVLGRFSVRLERHSGMYHNPVVYAVHVYTEGATIVGGVLTSPTICTIEGVRVEAIYKKLQDYEKERNTPQEERTRRELEDLL